MSDPNYSHILVPVDVETPDVSDKALRWAMQLARESGAALTILTVVPVWREDRSAVPPETEDKLNALVRDRDGLAVSTVIEVGGSISGRIIQTVEDVGADLVVMASHNPRMSDFLIGSNAAHVALHVPCSVLVVR